MAGRIREYEQQVSAVADIPGRRAQPSDFGGEGMLAAGQAVSKGVDAFADIVERQEVSDVHAKLAKARGDWTVYLQEQAQQAQPGDTSFSTSFNQKFGDYLQQVETGLQTRGARQAFQRGAAELSAHFVEKTGVFQAQLAGAKAVQDYNTALDAFRNTLVSDPTQFAQVQAQALAALNDPSGLYARMPPDKRLELESATRKGLALSAVDGLVKNGAPDLAKRQLMNGQWDAYLDADKKSLLIKEADVAIHAKDTEAERQRLLAEAERKKVQESTMDSFLKRVIDPKANGGALSDAEILRDNTLDSTHKQHLIDYKMRRARELRADHESRTNPAAVRDLMLQIHAADDDPRKTYNTDSVMAAYKKGSISTPEMVFLRREVEQMRDGNTQGFQKDVQQARSAVYTAMTRSIVGQTQPDVAADAAYRFNVDLENAVAKKRQANEDPRSLLDPSSKDYMLAPSRIQTYLRPAREAMGPAADAVRAKEALTAAAQVAAIEKNLTPQEMSIVNYHRNTVATGKTGRDENGQPVTVYSSTVQIQEGKDKGKYATVPGYYDGKIHTNDDEIYAHWKGEIAAGKWPVYRDPKLGDARAKFIHGIMDAESGGMPTYRDFEKLKKGQQFTDPQGNVRVKP